ncbi:OB-fold domain-containing protein [Actinomadura sp. 3N407]|uniref:OB-fold domain-containing protein n=1 Tax=Actinomadura sp. 3N407 TaxID=3457423 RepID=UPI003FCD0C35
MNAILGWGTYLPYWRLERATVAASVGGPGGVGARTVASYDEDTTSMAVEAGQAALASAGVAPRSLLLATADPAYLDKTNATAVHAALGLDTAVPAYDMGGAVRSGVGALRAALDGNGPVLVITADRRGGLPSGTEEVTGGDAASAAVIGPGPGAADYLGGASATAEFLERWRTPGCGASRVWEERFADSAYRPLGDQAVSDGLASAGIQAEDVDIWIITGTQARAVRRMAIGLRAGGATVVEDMADSVGNTGTAHPLLSLAGTLEIAEPGRTVALVVLADGAEMLLFRTTACDGTVRRPRTVAEQVATGRHDLTYPTYLTWRGLLDREPPRRPEPERPAAPVSYRARDWKFAFTASSCAECGTRQLPPQRTCAKCGATDRMEAESLAGVQGRIATFTIDRLAYSQNPPVVVGVVDFDGGGRFTCEITDVDAGAVAVGDRVEMTFRRLYTADGVHNYFWKARPIREGGQ